MTFHLLMAVSIAIISQFLVGYNTSVLNAPAEVVFPGHSTLSWSLAVSAFAIGGPVGSIAGGVLANMRGRKGTMMINTWIFLFGGILMTFAQSVSWLILSRFIVGISSGIAMVVVPVYLGEIAPPMLRGTLGTCTQFAIVIGILVSNLIAFPLATPTGWRYMFALSPILSVIQLVSLPYLVESPRWLLSHDEHSTQARIEIKKLRAFRNSVDVEQEVQNYLFASKQHKTGRSSAHSSGAMWDLLKTSDIRILVVSSVVLQIAQQLSGINAVFYYSTSFFQGVIDNPLMGTTLVGFVNLLATILALKLMDNTERRTLLLWSSGGMIFSMIAINLALLDIVNRNFALIAILLFVTSFAIGLGPIPWLIVAELFDSKYVATAMSLACIVNWTCNFIVGLSFPFCRKYLGAYSFSPFCLVLILSLLFIYFYLPETHGKTVEEVHREITKYRRKKSIDLFEESVVDMPVIQAVEMLREEGNLCNNNPPPLPPIPTPPAVLHSAMAGGNKVVGESSTTSSKQSTPRPNQPTKSAMKK
jgi:SP family facilitated glucose transporter-like MFS transporter 3